MRLRPVLVVPFLLAGALLSPSARAGAPSPTGPDVSKYQHDTNRLIDWGAVKRSGQAFTFIKASGHHDRVDPWFAREWAAAGRAGIIRGAYHYADPSQSADAQAALVVQTVGTTREARDLGIALDLEETGGLNPTQLAAWAHAFLDGVERRTGRVPILYTYVSFWQNQMANNRTFGAYPLWLARYGARPAPLAGWTQWTFWQHSSTSRLPGIPGYVDMNVLCCSSGTLTALADGRSSAITRLWRTLGGASGSLGLPLGPETAIAGGWQQVFQRGAVATTAAHGTHAVLAPIYAGYSAALGAPTGDAVRQPFGVVTQAFTGGVVVYAPGIGTLAINAPFAARWLKDGGVRSQEGVPVARGTAISQQFAGGGLYRTRTGVHLVPGALRDTYESLGGPASVLGLPASEAAFLAGTRVVSFDVGSLVEITVAGKPVVL